MRREVGAGVERGGEEVDGESGFRNGGGLTDEEKRKESAQRVRREGRIRRRGKEQ